jgi:hypothetical protein
LSDFERGQIVGACLAGALVTETAVLLGVLRVTASNVMLAYTNHGKTTSAKRNSERKSTLTERDGCTFRRIVSKNHRTTAAKVTAELNIHFEDPVSTKTVRCELHKSNIMVGLQLLNLWLLKVMLRCLNNGVRTIKLGCQTTGNTHVIWSDESSFTLFPTSGRVYVWRLPQEAYSPECLVPAVNHGGDSVMVWAAILCSVGPSITLQG